VIKRIKTDQRDKKGKKEIRKGKGDEDRTAREQTIALISLYPFDHCYAFFGAQ
jgi:hypothetical protein